MIKDPIMHFSGFKFCIMEGSKSQISHYRPAEQLANQLPLVKNL